MYIDTQHHTEYKSALQRVSFCQTVMYIKTQVYSLVYICLSLFFFSLIFFLFRLSVSTFISLKSLKSHAVGLFVRSIETPSIRMRKHNRGTSNIYTAADFQHFPRSYIPHVFCIELCTIYRPHSTRHYNKKKKYKKIIKRPGRRFDKRRFTKLELAKKDGRWKQLRIAADENWI